MAAPSRTRLPPLSVNLPNGVLVLYIHGVDKELLLKELFILESFVQNWNIVGNHVPAAVLLIRLVNTTYSTDRHWDKIHRASHHISISERRFHTSLNVSTAAQWTTTPPHSRSSVHIFYNNDIIDDGFESFDLFGHGEISYDPAKLVGLQIMEALGKYVGILGVDLEINAEAVSFGVAEFIFNFYDDIL